MSSREKYVIKALIMSGQVLWSAFCFSEVRAQRGFSNDQLLALVLNVVEEEADRNALWYVKHPECFQDGVKARQLVYWDFPITEF